MESHTIVLAIALLVLGGGYAWYVSLINRRNKALEALGSVDAQLQKRHDLVPNVLTAARRFMEHEKDVIERVTALRAAVQQPYAPTDPDQVRRHLEAEGALQQALGRLMLVAEAYPDLRSSQTMITAQQTMAEVESNIAAARRFYNTAVNNLNSAVEIWPGSLIAALVGVRALPFFEVEAPDMRKGIDAGAYLGGGGQPVG